MLNMFLTNYSYSTNQALFAGFTLTGGAIAQWHWQTGKIESNFSLNYLGHRVVAIIEAVPVIGFLITLIELVVKKYLYPAPSLSSLPPLSPPSLPSLSSQSPFASRSPKIDFLDRTCGFHESFEQVGSFSVIHPSSSRCVELDLRKIGSTEYHPDVTIYAPFEASNKHGDNIGWLSLQQSPSEQCLIVCRLDNFYYEFGVSPHRWDRKISGIGSALIQFAIEKSVEAGFSGKIRLFSTSGSGLFYYKMGLIANHPDQMIRLESAYKEDSYERIDGGDMYLPEVSLVRWREKIALNPISR